MAMTWMVEEYDAPRYDGGTRLAVRVFQVKSKFDAPRARRSTVVRAQKQAELAQIGWSDPVRKVLLAGIGALVLAREEIEDLVGKLVKKGELAEKDGRKLVRELVEQSGLLTMGRKIDALETMATGVAKNLMRRMKLVMGTDVAELEQKIDELSRQVARLEEQRRK
jgi:poly(hydroxyalkanoate) granule-associated protein